MKNSISFHNAANESADTIIFPVDLLHLINMLKNELDNSLAKKLEKIVIEGDIAMLISSLAEQDEEPAITITDRAQIYKFCKWVMSFNVYSIDKIWLSPIDRHDEESRNASAFMTYAGQPQNVPTQMHIKMMQEQEARLYQEMRERGHTCIGTQFEIDYKAEWDEFELIATYFQMAGYYLNGDKIAALGMVFDDKYAYRLQLRQMEEELAELRQELFKKEQAILSLKNKSQQS